MPTDKEKILKLSNYPSFSLSHPWMRRSVRTGPGEDQGVHTVGAHGDSDSHRRRHTPYIHSGDLHTSTPGLLASMGWVFLKKTNFERSCLFYLVQFQVKERVPPRPVPPGHQTLTRQQRLHRQRHRHGGGRSIRGEENNYWSFGTGQRVDRSFLVRIWIDFHFC